MKPALYMRVSTEEQRERQSIETQRDFAERYCELQGLKLSAVFADEGVSGSIPLGERPQGGRLLEAARGKAFDAVLVFKLDRLGRDTVSSIEARRELRRLGVRVVSMTEPFDDETASGQLVANVHSVISEYEKSLIVERSTAGTNRLARAGAWLGGVVPFGYRVEGKKREARLAPAEEPIPGLGMSEADVVRLVYRRLAEDGVSCDRIARELNGLGVPTVYAREGRALTVRGKRLARTAGVWRDGRIRNLAVSTTYKGLHVFGRRRSKDSRRAAELIERAVPALVSVEVWERAQETLRRNKLFASRNARRKYLLRGLIKCGACGCNYLGTAYRVSRTSPTPRVYYVCGGKKVSRGPFGKAGLRCPSKAISGSIEDLVWKDVETILRDPGKALAMVAERVRVESERARGGRAERATLEQGIAEKDAERERMLALYRRGRIDEATLDGQLDEIDGERRQLVAMVEQLSGKVTDAERVAEQIDDLRGLMRTIRGKLRKGLSWEDQRRIIELLVQSIRVDTIGEGREREATVSVTYRFGSRERAVCRSGSHPHGCPCGWLGHPKRGCRCTASELSRYAARVSGPVLDRIDLQVEVTALTSGELLHVAPGEPSEAVRERVLAARDLQRLRGVTNARLPQGALRACCALDAAAERLVADAVDRGGMSARAVHRALRVARTIADLAGEERVGTMRLAEALQYRAYERRQSAVG